MVGQPEPPTHRTGSKGIARVPRTLLAFRTRTIRPLALSLHLRRKSRRAFPRIVGMFRDFGGSRCRRLGASSAWQFQASSSAAPSGSKNASVTRPLARPGRRGNASAIATSLAIGRPALTIITSSLAASWSSSCDSRVLANRTSNVATSFVPADRIPRAFFLPRPSWFDRLTMRAKNSVLTLSLSKGEANNASRS